MDKRGRAGAAKFDGLSFQIKTEENPNEEFGLDNLDLEDVQLRPLSVKIMVKSDKKKAKDQPFAFLPKSTGNSPTRMQILDDKFEITTSAQTLVNFGVVVGKTASAAARAGRKGCLDPPFDVDPQAYGKSKVLKTDADPASSVAISSLLNKKTSEESEEPQNISILDNVPITTLFDRRSGVLDNNSMHSVARIEKLVIEPVATEKQDHRIDGFPTTTEPKGYDRRSPSGADKLGGVNNKLQPVFALESEIVNTVPDEAGIILSNGMNPLDYLHVRKEVEGKNTPLDAAKNNEQMKNLILPIGSGLANLGGMVAAAGGAAAAAIQSGKSRNVDVSLQDLDNKHAEKSVDYALKGAPLDSSKVERLSEHSNINVVSRNNVGDKDFISPIVGKASAGGGNMAAAAGRAVTMIQSETIRDKDFPLQDIDKKHVDQTEKSPISAPKGVVLDLSKANKPSHAKRSSQHSNTGVLMECGPQPTVQVEYNLPEPFLVTRVVLSAISTSAGVDEPLTKLHTASSHRDRNESKIEENGTLDFPINESIVQKENQKKTKEKDPEPAFLDGATAMSGVTGIATPAMRLKAKKHKDSIKQDLVQEYEKKNVNPDVSASSSKFDEIGSPRDHDTPDQRNLNKHSPVIIGNRNQSGIEKSNGYVMNRNISAIPLEPYSHTLQNDDGKTQDHPKGHLRSDDPTKPSVDSMTSESQKVNGPADSGVLLGKPEMKRIKKSIVEKSGRRRLSDAPMFPFLAKDVEPVKVEVEQKKIYETNSKSTAGNEKLETQLITKSLGKDSKEDSLKSWSLKTDDLGNPSKNNNIRMKELLDTEFDMNKVPNPVTQPIASTTTVNEENATRNWNEEGVPQSTHTIKMVDEEETLRLLGNSSLQSEKSSFLRQEDMDYSSPSGILSQNDDVTSRNTEINMQRSSPTTRLRSPRKLTASESIRSRGNSALKLSDIQKPDSPLHPHMTEILDPRLQTSTGKERSVDRKEPTSPTLAEILDNKTIGSLNKNEQNSLSRSNMEGQSLTKFGRSQIVSTDTEDASDKYNAQNRSSRFRISNPDIIGRLDDLKNHSTQGVHTKRTPTESLSPQNTQRHVAREDIDESHKPNISSEEITFYNHQQSDDGYSIPLRGSDEKLRTTRDQRPRSHDFPTKEAEAKWKDRSRSLQNEIINEEFMRHDDNINGIQALLAGGQEEMARRASSNGRYSPQKGIKDHKHEEIHRSSKDNIRNNDETLQRDDLSIVQETSSRQNVPRDSRQFNSHILSSLEASDPFTHNNMGIGELIITPRSFKKIATTIDDDGDEEKTSRSDTSNIPQDQPKPAESVADNNQGANNQDEEKKMDIPDELNRENTLDVLKNPTNAQSTKLLLNLAFRNSVVDDVWMLRSIDPDDEDEMADMENLFVISLVVTHTGYISRIPINHRTDAILSLHGTDIPEDITMLLNELESELRDMQNIGNNVYENLKKEVSLQESEKNVSVGVTELDPVTVINLSFQRSYSPDDDMWLLKTVDTNSVVAGEDTYIFIKNPLAAQEHITIPINEQNTALIIFRNIESIESTKQIEKELEKGVTGDQDSQDANNQNEEKKMDQPDEIKLDVINKPSNDDSSGLLLNFAFRNSIVDNVSILRSIDPEDEDEMADKENLFVISDVVTHTGYINQIPINQKRDAILSLHGTDIPEDITMLINELESELRKIKNFKNGVDKTTLEENGELNVSAEGTVLDPVTVVNLAFQRSYSPNDDKWILKTVNTNSVVAGEDTYIFVKNPLAAQEHITIPINEENTALIIFRSIESIESTKQIEKGLEKGVTGDQDSQDTNNQNEEKKMDQPDEIKLDVINKPSKDDPSGLLLNFAFRNSIVDDVSILRSIDPDDEDEMADKENLFVISNVVTHTGYINQIPINQKRDAILSLHGTDIPEDITMLLNELESELRKIKNFKNGVDKTTLEENGELNVSAEGTVLDPVTVVNLSFQRSYSPNDDKWILKTIDTKSAVADEDTYTFIKNPLAAQEYVTIPINEQNTALIIFRNIESIESTKRMEKEGNEGITGDVHIHLGFKNVYDEQNGTWTLVTFNPDDKDDSDGKGQIIKDTLRPNADYSHAITINPTTNVVLLVESAKSHEKDEKDNDLNTIAKGTGHATSPTLSDTTFVPDETNVDAAEQSQYLSQVDLAFKCSFSKINNTITLQTVDCANQKKTDNTYFITKFVTENDTFSTIPLTRDLEAAVYFQSVHEISSKEAKDNIVESDNKDTQSPKINISLAFNQRYSENDNTFTLQSLDPNNLGDDTIIVTKNDVGIGTLCVFPINTNIDACIRLKKTENKSKGNSSGTIRIFDADLKNQSDITPELAALVAIDFEGEDVLIKGSQFKDVNVETYPADANFPSNFVTSLHKEVHKTRVNAKNRELTLSIDAEKHKELCIEIVSNGKKITKFLQPGGSPVLYAHADKQITFQLKETDSDDGKSPRKKSHSKTIPNMRICRCHKKKT